MRDPRRAGALAALLVAAAATTAGLGRADEPVDGAANVEPSTPLTVPARAPVDVQLSARQRAARRAHDQVTSKLAERQDLRDRRVRAAYRLLRAAGSPTGVAPEHRLAVARRRATARWLLARDRDEVEQLADEASRLASALAVIDEQLADAGPAPPITLARPVPGPIVRSFGTLAHPASGATLTRRGLDFDAAPRQPVRAPADGVVRYAGPIRGLDHGVIIDHGGLWTVVAKLGAIEVAQGANVRRGATLGHPARRRVYLEVRLQLGPGGVPVDPAPMLD